MRARSGTAAALAAGLTAALTLAGAGPADAAAWPRSTVRSSTGVLRAALVQQRFVALDSTGSATTGSYVAGKLLGVTSTGYVDLENTGSVPARLTGTVGLATFLSTTVTVARCSSPWSGGACAGTQTTLVAAVLPARVTLDWAAAAVPAGGKVHLKVVLGDAVVNQLTLTATSRAARAAGDRTRA